MIRAEKIELPYSFATALQVLAWGAHKNESPYSHRQIAEWCYRFWSEYTEADAPSEIKKLDRKSVV